MAVRVLEPEVLKVTLQLPLPPESERVQLVSAPVMDTVPVGVTPDPLTVTLTVTNWPGVDGSGASAVMVVVETANPVDTTVWLSVSKLTV